MGPITSWACTPVAASHVLTYLVISALMGPVFALIDVYRQGGNKKQYFLKPGVIILRIHILLIVKGHASHYVVEIILNSDLGLGSQETWVQLSALLLLTGPPHPLASHCGKSFVLCFWFCFFSVLRFLWPSYLSQRSLCRQIWSHGATWLLTPSSTAAAASWTSPCPLWTALQRQHAHFYPFSLSYSNSTPSKSTLAASIRVIFKLLLQLGSFVTFHWSHRCLHLHSHWARFLLSLLILIFQFMSFLIILDLIIESIFL